MGIKAIENAVKDKNVKLIIIDELGRMELMRPDFEKAVKFAMNSGKHLLIVLHRSLVKKYKKLGYIFWLKRENKKEVKEKIISLLRGVGFEPT